MAWYQTLPANGHILDEIVRGRMKKGQYRYWFLFNIGEVKMPRFQSVQVRVASFCLVSLANVCIYDHTFSVFSL
jgi:hypothetical protein